MGKKATTVEYPKSLLVAYAHHGTDDEYLQAAVNPDELLDVGDGRSVKVARYVLAGTGVIHNTAPAYVEDAKA